MNTELVPDIYTCFDKHMEKRVFNSVDNATRHAVGPVDAYVKIDKALDVIETITRSQQVPVGEIVANDPVHGWHFQPYIGWEDIGAGAKLFAEAPKSYAPLELAKNLAMHAGEASILAGNPVCEKLMQECSKMITTLVQALEK
jgi:hypothetical protein